MNFPAVSLRESAEMICTTKSVVIGSILSTAVLQICVLIVCLLCIQIHRKKKSLEDDSGTGLRLRTTHRHQHEPLSNVRRRPSMTVAHGTNMGPSSLLSAISSLASSSGSTSSSLRRSPSSAGSPSVASGTATSINVTNAGLEINYGSNSSAVGLVVPCAAFATANCSTARRTAIDHLPLRSPSFRD